MATLQRPSQETSSAGFDRSLSETLSQVARRLRLARWLRHASRGVLIGIGVAILAVILAHFDRLPDRLPLEADIPLAILIGAAVGTITAYLRPIPLREAARLAETRLGLKERLSSALEFEQNEQTPRDAETALLLRLQREDAAVHARALKPVEAVPIKLSWETKALLPALALLILALVLPNLPIFIPAAVKTDRAITKKAGDKLIKTARLIEKRADASHMDATKRAAQDIQALGKRMAQGHMDRKTAMKQMAQLSKQLQAQQQKMAQANSGSGQGGKSLAQAGQQLAQALQSQAASGQSTPGDSAKPAGSKSPPGNHSAGNKNGSKSDPGSHSGGKNGKNGANGGQHGFNVPGVAGHQQGAQGQKNGQNSAQGQKPQTTPEMKSASLAMQQGNTQGLSQQLRQLAQRAQSGQLSPQGQKQAAQDLQKLSDALKGTPMSQTQQHAQAAADAMKQGDKAKAADEMRKAADAAEHEAQKQQDQQGMQDAQSSLQSSQGEMAGANSPSDIQDGKSGQSGQNGSQGGSPGEGKYNMPGSGPQQGSGKFNNMNSGQNGGDSNQEQSPGNGGHGQGRGGPSKPGPGHYVPDSGVGYKTPKQNVGVWRGGAHPLDPKFDPTKNPKYGKIFLGQPGPGSMSGGKAGPIIKTFPGTMPQTGQRNTSSVPYYNYAAPAKNAAEKAMEHEDVPPAYRTGVRRYFDSLQPPAKSH